MAAPLAARDDARRFLAGFVLLSALAGVSVGLAKVTTTLYALELGAGPAGLGLIAGAQSAGILLASLPAGLLLDRHGPRRLFVLGSLAVGLIYLVLPLKPAVGALVAGTAAISLLMPLRFVPLGAVFMSELNRMGDAKAGWFRGSHMVGMFLLGPSLAAGVVAGIGVAGSYGLIAALFALTALLASPVLAGRVVEGRGATQGWRGVAAPLALLRREPALARLCAVEFFAQAATMFYAFFIVAIAIGAFGFPEHAAARLLSLEGAAYVLALFALGGTLARWGSRRFLLASDALILPALVALGLASHPATLWLASPLLGLGLGMLQIANLSRLAKLGQRLGQGAVSSLTALIGPAGSLAGSVCGALVGRIDELPLIFLLFVPAFALFAWQHLQDDGAAPSTMESPT